MYYWEGELRCLDRRRLEFAVPADFQQRFLSSSSGLALVTLIKQMQKIPEERAKAEAKIAAKAKAKAKAKVAVGPAAVAEIGAPVVVDPEEELLGGTKIDKASFLLADLKKLASKTLHEGSVPFYGCSRCRFNRKGCINYKCHPDKFKMHHEKFPELYKPGTKQLSAEALKKLKNKDLIAGGGHEVEIELIVWDLARLLQVTSLKARYVCFY